MAIDLSHKAFSIHLHDLEKSFLTIRGKIDVIKGIDLTIKPGEFFVLLGPSGCGKSTLLNLVAGLEKPTSGQISVGDTIVAEPASKTFLDPFHRDVSMVFQSYALYPHMTVEKNLAFPLTNLKPRLQTSAIAQRVRKTASLLKIEDLLNQKPSELSGGQRQRVAIGRALVRKPRVFLMDEPLSNLDAQLRMSMRAQLKDLQRHLGITTIYVTHDQMEAMTLGDRMAIMNDGIIQQIGTPIDVYNNPSNIFVAKFIGSPPMNVFSGLVEIGEPQAILKMSETNIKLPIDLLPLPKTSSNTNITIGIRPEHLKIVEPLSGNMDADVNVIENVGSEYFVYCFLDEGQIVIRTQVKPLAQHIGILFTEGKTQILQDKKKNVCQ